MRKAVKLAKAQQQFAAAQSARDRLRNPRRWVSCFCFEEGQIPTRLAFVGRITVGC